MSDVSQSTTVTADEMIGVVASSVSNDRTGGTVTAQDRREAFAAALKAAREGKGWTQRQLAEKAGLKGGLIGHMETGRVGGSEEKIRALEDALGLPAGDLGAFLGHTPAPPPLEAAIKAHKKLPPSVKRAMLAVLAEFDDDNQEKQ